MAYPKAAKDAAQTGNLDILVTLTEEELSNILITLDGLGIEVKKKALDILMEREYLKGHFDGGDNDGDNYP
jgi:hypothetical protein